MLVGTSDPNQYLVYHVTNVGRRPVTITHAGGRMKNRHSAFMINLPQLPKKLDAHDYTLLTTHDLTKLTDVAVFTVTDSLGKDWPATKKSVQRLREDLAELVELD